MGSQMDYKVSIVIPAYNAVGVIGGCLESLANQIEGTPSFEVLLVDDGSSDDTVKFLEDFKTNDPVIGPVMTVLKQEINQGPAAARNAGARAAKGEVILFTDSDCVPERDWVSKMWEPFADSGIAAVKGAYRTRQKSVVARFAQAEFEDRYRLMEKASSIDVVFTYSAAFRRTIFLELGGFDTSFPVADNEDTEFSWRLVGAGHKIAFQPSAIVYHLHPHTLEMYLRKKYSRAYWRAYVYRRYPEKAIKDSYTPQSLKLQIGLAGMSLMCAAAAVIDQRALVGLLLVMLVFAGTVVPFVRQMREQDLGLRLAAVGITYGRAVVMGFGLVASVPMLLRGHVSPQTSKSPAVLDG